MIQNNKKILAIVLVIWGIIIAIAVTTLSAKNTLTQTNDTWTDDSQVHDIQPHDTQSLDIQSLDTQSLDIQNLDTQSPDLQSYDTQALESEQKLQQDESESLDTYYEHVVMEPEPFANLTPSQQTMFDAGYGNVVLLPTGNYGVLMQGPEHTIEGKTGNVILREYLTSIGLEGSIAGGWMNETYYHFIASNIHEIDTSGNEW